MTNSQSTSQTWLPPTHPLVVTANNQARGRETLLDRAIKKTTPARMKAILQAPLQKYAPGTVKSHPWAIKLYETFIECMNTQSAAQSEEEGLEPEEPIPAWPLNLDKAVPFMRFLGVDCGYALSTIDSVLIPALFRVHKDKAGVELNPDEKREIREAIADVALQVEPEEEPGKAPAIYADVEYIIKCIPEGLLKKAEEAALFLMAVSTGARAVTCANIQLGDILSVNRENGLAENSSIRLIQVRFRRCKGINDWDHIVALRGDTNVRNELDIVYWLEQHLNQNFGVSLHARGTWPEGVKTKPLWDISTESMRTRFKSRAMAAGYPVDLFGFHSLRSGFLCSAVINASTNPNNIGGTTGIMEHAAAIGGWRPFGRSQRRYLKTAIKSIMVCTELVMPNRSGNSSGSLVATSLITPEAFHCLETPLMSNWPKDANYETFFAMVEKRFTVAEWNDDPAKQLSIRKKAWREAFKGFFENSTI